MSDEESAGIPIYGQTGASADEDDDPGIEIYAPASDGEDSSDDADDFEIPVYGVDDDDESEAADREPIAVGVAEYAVTDENRPLRTSGLGSCVGLAVHDEETGISGLLHYMLPTAEESNGRNHDAAKFADTGIDALLTAFADLGGDARDASVKIAGGATMVEFNRNETPIGVRNVDAARRILSTHDLRIGAEDVGGAMGRSIRLDPETGTLTVSGADGSERTL